MQLLKKTILIVVLACFVIPTTTFALPTTTETVVLSEEDKDFFQKLEIESVEDFLALSPRDIKEKTGKKLSLKEVIAFKVAKKKIKKQLKKGGKDGSKSQLIALLLVVFVGGLGIHRFYLGYTTIGIIQLLTLGGCGIWALIDLIRIVLGDLGPADGSSYDPTL